MTATAISVALPARPDIRTHPRIDAWIDAAADFDHPAGQAGGKRPKPASPTASIMELWWWTKGANTLNPAPQLHDRRGPAGWGWPGGVGWGG
ncbi:hypothetical protein NKG94_45320 [Micromonospora sp. M12]